MKDPKLSDIATRKFHYNVDRTHDDVMCIEGAVVSDIIKVREENKYNFEVELPNDKTKLKPGTEMRINKEIPIE